MPDRTGYPSVSGAEVSILKERVKELDRLKAGMVAAARHEAGLESFTRDLEREKDPMKAGAMLELVKARIPRWMRKNAEIMAAKGGQPQVPGGPGVPGGVQGAVPPAGAPPAGRPAVPSPPPGAPGMGAPRIPGGGGLPRAVGQPMPPGA